MRKNITKDRGQELALIELLKKELEDNGAGDSSEWYAKGLVPFILRREALVREDCISQPRSHQGRDRTGGG